MERFTLDADAFVIMRNEYRMRAISEGQTTFDQYGG